MDFCGKSSRLETLPGSQCFKEEKKQLELFAVCDKKISFNIDMNEIKNREKWLPGWEE